MAKEAKPEAAGAEAAPPKKSKKLLIIIIVTLLLVLLLGGGAATFLIMKKNAAEGHEDEEVATETAKSSKKKANKEASIPVYVAMDVFTVNLAPEAGEQYVQLVLSVEVDEVQTGDKIKSFMPKIRNNVMLLLSSKKASELLTKEGKETLAAEIRDQLNQILAPGAKKDEAPVKEVLFTSFIIQ
jgi:flagellar FliL protein